eukprot:CAMPEP_0179096802 /NCGR_PEP_ID=MMETSP0796-20121207/44520_1 /TAXON_ID=73915 /ORGANISM="Pyrodinium bahamense, Strain pbaha01" /LENGTH=413 /DNA_ID=CAMNT_0020794529 /DNA_START=465 /DNA_END=1704 /DNA_ORIENTATION=+
MRIRRDELQDVVRRGRTRAAAALADWQGSVVVEEENHLAIPVAQADPLGGSLAVVLTAVVLTDVSLALGNPSEPGLPPGDGEGPAAVDEAVVPGEAPVPRVPEDAARVVALLEAHQVVLLGAACLGDLPAGALAVAMPLAEQVPPEEVVGKDLEIRGSASGRAGLEVPALRRDAHLAPGACALQRGGGAPADEVPGGGAGPAVGAGPAGASRTRTLAASSQRMPGGSSAEPERRRQEHMTSALRRRVTWEGVQEPLEGASSFTMMLATSSQRMPEGSSAEPERRRQEHMASARRRRVTCPGVQVHACSVLLDAEAFAEALWSWKREWSCGNLGCASAPAFAGQRGAPADKPTADSSVDGPAQLRPATPRTGYARQRLTAKERPVRIEAGIPGWSWASVGEEGERTASSGGRLE